MNPARGTADTNPVEGPLLRVPAGQVASYADVIAVGAEVVKLRGIVDTRLTRLQAITGLLDQRSIIESAYNDE